MKTISYLFIVIIALYSCNDDEQNNPELNHTNIFGNNLITGTSPSSFQRIIDINNHHSLSLVSVKQTPDLGYIFCGYIFVDYGPQIFILKTNDFGESEWLDTISSEFGSESMDVEVTEDNGFVITGMTFREKWHSMGAASDGFLMRIDNNGHLIWQKSFSIGEIGRLHSVCTTNDGGFLTLGFGYGVFGIPNEDYLIKTNLNGEEIWRQTIQLEGRFWHLEKTKDGGFVLCGKNESGACILKINNLGEELWSSVVTFDNYYNCKANCIKELEDGYVICGWHSNLLSETFRFVAKLDNYGNEIWTKNYGPGFIGEPDYINKPDYSHDLNDIIQTSDNNFIALGWERYEAFQKTYLIKINSENGDIIWQKPFNPGESNMLLEVQNSTDNGFIVAGYTASYLNGNSNSPRYGYIVKTDENGN